MVKGVSELLSAVFSREQHAAGKGPLAQERCLVCNTSLEEEELYRRLSVCPECRFHYSITARQRIQLLAEPKSFKEKYRTISSLDPLSFKGKSPYRKRLFRDQRRTGLTEAAVVGECRIEGIKTVLVLLDFSFMGGSMGCVVGEKLALAFEHALGKRLPIVAVVSSGGVRIQEGILSLMQMAKTSTTVNRLHEAGLPYIALLVNPTTGQAYASFANQADIILAEPGALVGFSPLRVLQETEDSPLPLESHTAEAHMVHGMVDSIVDREEMVRTLADLLGQISPQRQQVKFPRPRAMSSNAPPPLDSWEALQRVRRADRPTASDYVKRIATGFVDLHGDRVAGDDPAIICGFGSVDGCSVVIVGQERQRTPEGEARAVAIAPEGFRKAQRAMNLAAKFGMPLITLIDTVGPDSSRGAEDRGIGSCIAGTMRAMAGLSVPSIAVIIGEGGREGALALSIGDRILMSESAILTPISPEAAASMMYRDDTRVEDAARSLRLTAGDALEMKIIDAIVPEPAGGPQEDPDEAARLLKRSLVRALGQVQNISRSSLLSRRYRRFRNVGEYTSYFYSVLNREIDALQSYVVEQAKEVRSRRRRRRAGDGKILTLPVNPEANAPSDPEGMGDAPPLLQFPTAGGGGAAPAKGEGS